MTLFEIVFSIPGLIAMTFIVPCLMAFIIEFIAAWTAVVIDMVQDHQKNQPKPEPEQEISQPDPRPANIIDFDTVAAISHIRNHEAMQFVSKN